MIRLRFLIVFLALMAFNASAEPSRVFKFSLQAEPETMDPSLNYSVAGSRVLHALFEPLVRLDEKCVAQPAMAESWEHNEDFTQWTFHLRKNARWHNGDPVTSKDFLYGAQRTLTKRLSAPYADNVRAFLKGGKAYYDAGGLDSPATLEGIQTPDNSTVVYTLEFPTPFFPQVVDMTCWFPVNEKAVRAGGDNWFTKPETYVGNGPFRMAEYRSKERMAMKKAETYWDKDSIFWEEVCAYFIDSQNTEMTAFKTGELDVTQSVALGDVNTWRDKPEYNKITIYGTYYLSFNDSRPPFNDARVRRAFNFSVNRDVIANRLLRRGELPSKGFVPENGTTVSGAPWREKTGDLIGPQNIVEAKKLMKEAGFEGGKGFPQVEYTYDTKEEHRMIAEQLQAMWKSALGIDVKLQPVEWNVRLTKGRSGDFQIVRNGWYGDYTDAMTFLEMFVTGSALNDSKYSNPKYDDLITKAREEKNAEAREQLMIEAERLLVKEDMATLPLLTYSDPILVRTNVKGIVRNSVGGLDFTRARRVE
ncbi:peptide ABC transporter substrate-binding protein [Candidatus Sumerlaeota bacterium]|nr:peptide ABC transporter substrate-binding protein [Candidatus Sumerlaeota bacterium]